METPPFYGMRLWPKVHHTMGGIQISPKAQVIDLAGTPIAGFFAAGEVTGGVHGAVRLGSNAIAGCLVFGLGVPELVVVMIIVLIVFGAGKLPQIGSGIGKGLKNFKSAVKELPGEMTATEGKKGAP